ncbi:MAG TPA: (5-formylfuran-3-yl)methyl phosphate synthase [Geminicoccaceae bacterium]|nr:(5-formylfuran-3-yl)methyl phosphate synthase [Geminicoccaceae bacterium]
MTRLLASVLDLAEAEQALALGADILDLKDPRRGALGAWQRADVQEAVRRLDGRRPLSATLGDLPMVPALLAETAAATAATGVDYVKVGFFAGGDHAACAAALATLAAGGARLVAVLMADQSPDPPLLPRLAAAGFAGAMLDTADKRAGGLRAHQDEARLAAFIAEARRLGLLTGLAGSLAVADIPPLCRLEPDYLGFRGALCGDAGREAALDAAAFRRVRAALDQSAASSAATATAGAEVAAAAAVAGSTAATRPARSR